MNETESESAEALGMISDLLESSAQLKSDICELDISATHQIQIAHSVARKMLKGLKTVLNEKLELVELLYSCSEASSRRELMKKDIGSEFSRLVNRVEMQEKQYKARLDASANASREKVAALTAEIESKKEYILRCDMLNAALTNSKENLERQLTDTQLRRSESDAAAEELREKYLTLTKNYETTNTNYINTIAMYNKFCAQTDSMNAEHQELKLSAANDREMIESLTNKNEMLGKKADNMENKIQELTAQLAMANSFAQCAKDEIEKLRFDLTYSQKEYLNQSAALDRQKVQLQVFSQECQNLQEHSKKSISHTDQCTSEILKRLKESESEKAQLVEDVRKLEISRRQLNDALDAANAQVNNKADSSMCDYEAMEEVKDNLAWNVYMMRKLWFRQRRHRDTVADLKKLSLVALSGLERKLLEECDNLMNNGNTSYLSKSRESASKKRVIENFQSPKKGGLITAATFKPALTSTAAGSRRSNRKKAKVGDAQGEASTMMNEKESAFVTFAESTQKNISEGISKIKRTTPPSPEYD